MSTSEPNYAKHMPALDGLRGLAILLIMGHNFSTLEGVRSMLGKIVDLGLNFGWVGVQLFFVLSGFLITNILISTRGSSNYFRSFYGRRTLRIFPLYYASLIVGLLLVPLFTGKTLDGSEHQVWLWTYLSNWAVPSGRAVAAYPHMWSLAVEEQFYLLWPLLVYWLSRAALLRTCLTFAFVALAVRIYLRMDHGNFEEVYQYTICRIDALTLGGAAAILFRQESVRAFISTHRKQVRIGVVVGLCVVFVITKGAPRTGILTQTYGYTLIALLAALIILDFARTPDNDKVGALFSWAPLRRVGLYSYSAYVIHKPLHEVLGKPALDALGIAGRATQSWPLALTYFAAATLATFVLAAVTYHVFEMPFLKLKRFFLATKGAHKTYIP